MRRNHWLLGLMALGIVLGGIVPALLTLAPAEVGASSTYSIKYSLHSNRRDAVELDGATVSGRIYPFTAPDTDVKRVVFYLDDKQHQVEENAPFDFNGGNSSKGTRWDTKTVAEGKHTIKAEMTMKDGSTKVVTATFTVDNIPDPKDPEPTPTATATPPPPPTATPTQEPPKEQEPAEGTGKYSLVYSTSSDRKSPAGLNGATVRGNVYVFTTPDDGVEDVDFYLDGKHYQFEDNGPFDFAGGNSKRADAWKTEQVSDGQHTIKAEMLLKDGSHQSVSATFTVANNDDGSGDGSDDGSDDASDEDGKSDEPTPGPEPDPALPENPNVDGMRLVSTFRSISVYVEYGGSADALMVEWREAGGSWKRGHDLYVDHADNEARGSLVGLNPSTLYEVRVGNKVASVATRSEATPVGNGKTYYVAVNGNDSNAGTSSAPFRTIQKALNVVNAGDTIEIKAGTYKERLILTRSGAPGNPITITNYGNDKVVIDGSGHSERVFTLDRADHVVISGLEIRNGAASLLYINDSDNVYIENNRLIEPARNVTGDFKGLEGAVHLRNGSANAVVRNNEIHRNTQMTKKMSIAGIVTWRAGAGAAIYGNTITGGFEDGVRYGPEDTLSESQSRDVDIYENLIDGACFDDGIQPEGAAMNVRVWGNTIRNCYVSMAFAPSIEGPLYVFRNLVYDNMHPNRGGSGVFKLGDEDDGRRGPKYIYHNTMVVNAPAGEVTVFKQTNNGLGNVISRNNIAIASKYVAELGCDMTCDMDWDAVHSTDSGRFIEYRSKKFWDLEDWCEAYQNGCNGVELDGTGDLRNPSAGDYRLASNSQLIDRGTTIYGFNTPGTPWAHRGSAPDIGAFEQ